MQVIFCASSMMPCRTPSIRRCTWGKLSGNFICDCYWVGGRSNISYHRIPFFDVKMPSQSAEKMHQVSLGPLRFGKISSQRCPTYQFPLLLPTVTKPSDADMIFNDVSHSGAREKNQCQVCPCLSCHGHLRKKTMQWTEQLFFQCVSKLGIGPISWTCFILLGHLNHLIPGRCNKEFEGTNTNHKKHHQNFQEQSSLWVHAAVRKGKWVCQGYLLRLCLVNQPSLTTPAPRNKALLRAFQPLVSLNKAF